MSRYETSRLAFIDSLRLIAALLVVFQHLAERHRESSVSIIVELGPGIMGVVLFFLVSGYVIPFSVRAGLDIPSFLVRRLCRIYPLFLVAVAVVAIGGWTGWLENWSSLRDATPIRWAANLLLVQDFVHQPAILGVSWTLIIELIWYALFAGSLRFFGERSAQILSIFVPVSLVLLAFASLAIDSRIPLGRPAMIYAAVLGYQVFRFHTGLTSARSLMANVGVFLVVTSFTNWVAFGAFRHPHVTLYQALGPWTLANSVPRDGFAKKSKRNAPLQPGLGPAHRRGQLLDLFAPPHRQRCGRTICPARRSGRGGVDTDLDHVDDRL
jgi:peptidoglycan/LPS O-acetylase OafA/YrhL